ARFWDVNSGEICIGGVPIKEMTTEELLANISMVFQDVYLFRDTIEANIRMGKSDATHEEIVEAARRAACHEFIMSLPDGYDTMVGEGGSTLSGGEKQRISIARALLKDAPVILLDEATSSLDPENEVLIQQAISALVEDKTVIVIAHRLQSVCNADQIVVLDDGCITEKGTHDELLAYKGPYARLWDEQNHAGSWRIRQ
nr:ATP-binding cassette domain-containing protein [Lachnospiraceae bacterium]